MLRRDVIEKDYRTKAIYLSVPSCLGLGWNMPGQVWKNFLLFVTLVLLLISPSGATWPHYISPLIRGLRDFSSKDFHQFWSYFRLLEWFNRISKSWNQWAYCSKTRLLFLGVEWSHLVAWCSYKRNINLHFKIQNTLQNGFHAMSVLE